MKGDTMPKKRTYKLDPEWEKRYGHEPTYQDIFAYFGQPVPPKETALPTPKYEIEQTCFAYDPKEKTGCKCLKDSYCRYGKCNFYIPKDEYERKMGYAT